MLIDLTLDWLPPVVAEAYMWAEGAISKTWACGALMGLWSGFSNHHGTTKLPNPKMVGFF